MNINKNKAVKILLIAITALIVGVLAYVYLPKIFGDLIYPINYEEHIVKYANEYALEPSLVAGIIYTESHFYPNASSHAGAQGLMQILPSTGQAIASRLGEPFGDLFDPETNIRYGTSYIRSHFDSFGQDIEAALVAYNGGGGAAERFLVSRSDSDIPSESANYYKKVIAAQKKYEELYGNILNAENVTEALKIKQIEQEKSWFEKLLENIGFK